MRLLPRPGLARRITLAMSALACLVVVSGGIVAYLALQSMVERQVSYILRHGLETVTSTVDDRLHDVVGSLNEMSANRLIRNSLIDDSGRETYLLPFLQGFRQISDLPVSVAVTEFDGRIFATNGIEDEMRLFAPWVAGVVERGRSDVLLDVKPGHESLMLAAPVIFPNTGLPEGALVYHVHPAQWLQRDPLVQDRNTLSWLAGIELEIMDPRGGPAVKLMSGSTPIKALNRSGNFAGPGPLSALTFHIHLYADPELLNAPAQRLLLLVGGAGAAILLLTILLSRFVGERIAARLNRLQSSVAEVMSHEEAHARFADEGTDEVAQLAGAFNEMLQRLESAYRQLDFRRRAELDQSEERFRAVLEQAGDAIYLIDADSGRFLDGNGKAHDSLGYSREELLALNVGDIHPPGASVCEAMTQGLESGATITVESMHRRKDGSVFPVEVNLGLMTVGRQRFNLSVARDISERRRSEKAMRERALIVSQMSDALIVADLGGRITDWNPGAERIFGYAAAEIIGRELSCILGPPGVEPGTVRGYLARALRDSHWSGEVAFRRQDGHEGTCEAVLAPFKDEHEQLTAILGVFRDVTEKKLMEQELLQAQKMEAVGQLTGGVAHDFNNLLQIIFGNLELARRALPPDAERLESYVDTALAASTHAADLTRQLLAFSRKQQLYPRPVEPNTLISGVLKLLRRTLGGRIVVQTQLSDDVPPILVDPSAMESAILNLAVNAKAAMPDGGELTVATSALNGRDPSPGPGSVKISVRDSGVGMAPEVQQRAFEPFYTTKPAGEGTGLGLSSVYGFVSQSGGSISLESEPGRGTTVHMVFPALPDACPAGEVAERTPLHEHTGHTVLVVEDESQVRATILTMVEACGFKTIEAHDAETALAIVRERPGVSLLLTDIILGQGLDGYALARAATNVREDLPVLLCTGYSEGELAHTHALDGAYRLLRKPYTFQQLSETLHAMLGV